MTRTLILMRHAKSSWDDLSLADHQRPLNARGRDSATAMGHWLKTLGFVPQEALISDSQRTQETCERLGCDVNVILSKSLYLGGADIMMNVLRTSATGDVVLMLGHNPGIAEFAARLVSQAPRHKRFADYPTGATTIMRFDALTWADVTWSSGVVVDFAIPREIMV